MLDLLRLVAALAVVAYHYTAFRQNAFGAPTDVVFPSVGRFTGVGALGVQLFFVISGFVILMSLWGRSIQDFTASRAARLLPAYVVAVLVSGIMMVAFHPAILEGIYGRTTSSDVIANLTMMQSALGVQNLDGVYWTLFAEFRFYVLVGLLSLWGLTRGRVIAFAFFWPVLGELANTAGSPLAASLLGGRHAAFFAAGMVIYLMYRDGRSMLLWLLLGMQWAFAMRHAGTDLVSAINGNTGQGYAPETAMATVTLAFAAVLVATLTPFNNMSWRWMSFAGGLTYPLYLIHENWGWVIISATHETLGQWTALAVAVTAVLIAAATIHVFVERPLAPRIRRAVREGLESPRAPRPSAHGPMAVPAPEGPVAPVIEGSGARHGEDRAVPEPSLTR